MLHWKSFPVFKWLIPFVLGILSAHFWGYQNSLIPILLFLILVAVVIMNRIRGNIRLPKIIIILLFIGIYLLGYQRTILNNDLNKSEHFKNYLEPESSVLGMVSKMPVKKGERIKIILDSKQIGTNADSLKNCSGKLLLYLPQNETTDKLSYGDLIMVRPRLQKITPPKNPNAFNYKRYLHFQNIHYQGFVEKDNWLTLNANYGNPVLKLAFKLRGRFIEILRKYLPDENDFSVGSALILGYKDELREEVRAAYAHTGAMHVLAVSGLHVGLIFFMLNILLKIVRTKAKWWKITRAVILILAVWAYAILTGASPSVLRASTMFSFLIVGLALNQPHDIYNSLAISAILLLGYDPNLIMNVGFQLSYMAVLGIVYFQPNFANLWFIQNKIGNYLWQLACVSFAAQLTTLPLGFFYFHQFPIYFWLSGLIVVPAAAVILGGGIFLFIFEMTIPFFGSGIGQALEILISIVNWCIFTISKIPGSLVQGIWFGMGTVLLLYFSIGSLVRAINTKRMKWLVASSVFILIISTNFSFTQFQNSYNKKMVVYHIYKNSLIDFIDGQHVYALQNIEITPKTTQFAAENYRWSLSVKEIEPFHFSDKKPFQSTVLFHHNEYYLSHGINFIQFFDLKIAILSDALNVENFYQKMEVDFIIIRNNPYLKIEDLSAVFDFKAIIFDGSNGNWKSKKWSKSCKELSINYWNVAEKGAFIFEDF